GRNIGVIVYSPLASGLLAGAMTPRRIAELPADDWRRNSPDYREPQLSRNLRLVELLRIAGRHYGHTPGEVAVAWVLRNPAVTAAIVGARRPGQPREPVGPGQPRITRPAAATSEAFLAPDAAGISHARGGT